MGPLMEFAIVCLVAASLLVFGFWLLVRGANTPVPPPQVPEPPATEPFPQIKVFDPTYGGTYETNPGAPAIAVPTPAPKGRTVRIILTSGKGRKLGELQIVAAARRPVLRHKTGDGQISVFVADHQESKWEWVYRRVGVERA